MNKMSKSRQRILPAGMTLTSLMTVVALIFLFSSSHAVRVITTSPAQNALNVDKAATIQVAFDVPMNPATINVSTFIATGNYSGYFDGIINYDDIEYKASFDATRDFDDGEVVTVILTNGIETQSGTSLTGGYIWSFTVTASGVSSGAIHYNFSYRVGDQPVSVYSADFDNDGDNDLAVANSVTDNISVLLNNGDGTFGEDDVYPAGDLPRHITAADFNRDGYIDLATANDKDHTVSVLMNDGDGSFTFDWSYTVGETPVAIVTADLDGDGDMDLVTGNDHNTNTISILLNNGTGAFIRNPDHPVMDNPFSVAAGDIDLDGDIDLVTGNWATANISVLMNNGNGTFAPEVVYPVDENPRSAILADFDSDGYLDVATANHSSDNISILMNEGDGTFAVQDTYIGGNRPYSICALDVNGDGFLDLAVANAKSEDISIFMNNGTGGFLPQMIRPMGKSVYSVFGADLDGDGDIDLATADFESDNIAIFRNLGCIADTDGDMNGDPGNPENECPDDNCPDTFNPDQYDADNDGIGDVCDECTDTDGDGYGDPGYPANICLLDNCFYIFNPDQADSNGDGIGDACNQPNMVTVDVAKSGAQLMSIDTLYVGGHYEFRFWLANNYVLGGMSLGFQVWSDNGVTWEYVSQPDGKGYTTSSVTLNEESRMGDGSVFDMTGLLVTEQNIDTHNRDTMMYGGVAMAVGLPLGGLEHMVSWHFRPTGPWIPGIVGTFCLDTSFVPPCGCGFCFVDQYGSANMPAWGGKLCLPVKLVCGNPNGDNDVNVGDAVFMINYIFRGGPSPNPWQLGDANCDGTLDVGDIVFLIAASFRYGPQPECPDVMPLLMVPPGDEPDDGIHLQPNDILCDSLFFRK